MEGKTPKIKELTTLESHKSSIDLSLLTFNFCSDDLIKDYYTQRLESIKDKDLWISENKDKLEREKDSISKAVEMGLIPDDEPETIWQFKLSQLRNGREKVLKIKIELENNVEIMKKKVAERLSIFLPNWTMDKVSVFFTMNDNADYCADKDITIDLGRLSYKENFSEETEKGITHEAFHVWMADESKWSDQEQGNATDEELRDHIISKTIDEGLAVLVSDQSLKAHHEQKGKEYSNYIQESFNVFNNFILTTDRKELEKIKEEEFQDMGHFYVVGNEIAKAIYKDEGIVNFKKIIEQTRTNPSKMLDIYKDICAKNQDLPKITD